MARTLLMPSFSDEELTVLVLSDDKEAFEKLLEYRHQVGQFRCVRRMLALFASYRSPDLCRKAWEAGLTVCLTDDEPQMDDESSQLWTEAFLRALRHPSAEIRIAAADAWGLGLRQEDFSERILQALLQGLADESEDVRFSFGLLMQGAGRAALPYLFRALVDSPYQTPHHNREDRCSSVWDLLFTLDGILSRFSAEPEDRRKCIELVAGFLRERSVDDGMDYLDIWKAGETLGETIGGWEALNELSTLINHADPRVRESVAHALSHINEDEARTLLRSLANDPAESVRLEAFKYLKESPA